MRTALWIVHMPADDRRYPKHPLVGVGAILLRRDRILMAQRGKEPLKGWWSLPGGALETGESLAEAVCREVREETGLEIRPLGVLEIFERIMRDAGGRPEYHYVLIDYVCRITGGTLLAGDDVARVEWVRRADLGALQITEGTLGVIEKAFRERGAYRRAATSRERLLRNQQVAGSIPAGGSRK
jgi:8-oxo-dGTP diphosphatase